MKILLSVFILSFMSASFACDQEMDFVERSLKNPRSILAQTLTNHTIVSVNEISNPDACQFTITSDLDVGDGYIAMCFTHIGVSPASRILNSRDQKFEIEFLSPDRTLCFI